MRRRISEFQPGSSSRVKLTRRGHWMFTAVNDTKGIDSIGIEHGVFLRKTTIKQLRRSWILQLVISAPSLTPAYQIRLWRTVKDTLRTATTK